MSVAAAAPAVVVGTGDVGDLLSADEVAKYVGISPNDVILAATMGHIPDYIIAPTRLEWRLADLRHFDKNGWLPPRGWRPYQSSRRV